MNISSRLAISACLALTSPWALAVNYPTELAVRITDSATGPPTVLVDFMNNEGDLVLFAFEAIFDGVMQPRWPGTNNGDVACTKSADANACAGVPIGSGARWSNTKGHRAFQVLRIQRDTDYCFRVKANDGIHDSAWTPQVCAHTPPPPRRPATAPKAPQVTLLEQGTSGRGEVGPAKPGRVLVEWNMNAADVAWFAVERADAVTSPVSAQIWTEVGRVTPPLGLGGGDLELIETITDPSKVPGATKRVNYRVCASNVGGKTCSTSASYPPAYLKQTVGNAPAPSLTPPRPTTVSPSGSMAGLRIAAPQILAPAPGASVVHGLLRLQVSAPGIETSAGEVEFSWQQPRGGKLATPPTVALWKVPMADLVKGALVPPGEGPTQAGVWVVRVRSVRGATADPWSEPVSFSLSQPAWVKAATTAVVAEAPARSSATQMPARQMPVAPLQQAPTAIGARATLAR